MGIHDTKRFTRDDHIYFIDQITFRCYAASVPIITFLAICGAGLIAVQGEETLLQRISTYLELCGLGGLPFRDFRTAAACLRINIVAEEVCVRPPVHPRSAVRHRRDHLLVNHGRVLALAGLHALLLHGADLVAREAGAEAATAVEHVAAGVAMAAAGEELRCLMSTAGENSEV